MTYTKLIERLNKIPVSVTDWKTIEETVAAIEALQSDRYQLQRDFTYMKQQRDALQSQLDTMGKGELVGFVAPHDLKTLREGYPATVVMLPSNKRTEPLFAAPKALAPLTDEQIDRAALEQVGFDGCGTQPMNTTDIRRIVRAAHGIGCTP